MENILYCTVKHLFNLVNALKKCFTMCLLSCKASKMLYWSLEIQITRIALKQPNKEQNSCVRLILTVTVKSSYFYSHLLVVEAQDMNCWSTFSQDHNISQISATLEHSWDTNSGAKEVVCRYIYWVLIIIPWELLFKQFNC